MATTSNSLELSRPDTPEIDSQLLPRLDTDETGLSTRHPFIAYKDRPHCPTSKRAE